MKLRWRLSLIGVFCVSACAKGPDWPAGMVLARQTADPMQWQSWIELVPSLRPPTTADGTAHIRVFAELPEEGKIELVEGPLGRAEPEWPLGTKAVRVEFLGPDDADAPLDPSWQVLDVRMTNYLQEGESSTVLRPADSRHLAGVQWTNAVVSDAAAGAALAELVRTAVLSGPNGAAAKREAGRRLERLNDCRSCHLPYRPMDLSPGALVQRGTDARGAFQLKSVFEDEGPAERYRSRDLNGADVLINWRCDGEPHAGTGDSAPLEAPCAGGRRRLGRLNVRQGLLINDAHVLSVCASRRALASHLSSALRQVWSEALEECGVGSN